jgi:hypothetical protein
MGILLDDELRTPRSEWEPVNAGAERRLRGKSSATLLEERAGRWEYGAEIPILVSLHDVEVVGLPGGAGALYWSGIGVRMKRSDLPGGRSGPWFLTASLEPNSYLWCGNAPLLPGESSGSGAYRDALRAVADTKDLSELTFDLFESDPGWLVARLGDPFRPHWDPGNEVAGDGFLVVRNRNRRSSAKRRWVFGLSAVPPEEVVRSLMLMDDVPKVSKAPRRPNPGPAADPERRLDGTELRQMDAEQPYMLDAEQTELCLEIAAWQCLGCPEGLAGCIGQRMRSVFEEHYRNWDQRFRLRELPRRRVRARLEAAYRAFLEEHPDCDRLRPRGRLDLSLLNPQVELPDEAARRCRDLFLEYFRKWPAR